MDAPRFALAWRFAMLGGLAAGLGLSPHLTDPSPLPPPALALAAAALALRRPRPGAALATGVWLVLLATAALAGGTSLGAARLEALDARAFPAPLDTQARIGGHVAVPPRVTGEGHSLVIASAAGRIGVVAPALPPDISLGSGVEVMGVVREPSPLMRPALERGGARLVVAAQEIRLRGARRGGLRGVLDRIRERAEHALERGAAASPSALLRGFVLGQDDRIAPHVREEFRRSGLSHILAVSGQNVMLLALLAAPLLALAGVPHRSRLLALIALVAVYVPVAGAGPSIQRAGVMGIAGLVAALAGRPASRWYAIVLAAAITLALDPRASFDVGWQLSFAAVAGLLVLAAPLAQVLCGDAAAARPARRALAEGAAMTLAATLATAPLVAHHFGVVSLTALPANLLALPAVAPAMWTGMLAAALGQIPGAPLEPIVWLGGLCSGYIGWIASLLGGDQAQLEVSPPSAAVALAWTLLLLAGAALALRWIRRREGMGPPGARRLRALALGSAAALALWLAAPLLGGGGIPGPRGALALDFLDVGQGDAILLRPRGSAPVLIDTGPPGEGIGELLRERGVERLGALLVTHPDRDHAGALAEVLGTAEVELIGHGPDGFGAGCGSPACPPTRELAAGARLRSGRLRLEVLWPPPGAPAGAEPNHRSLVVLARLGEFEALLPGDAEAEVAPVSAPPVDVLKIAHHGSADGGLAALLDRVAPRLAVISVGEGNSYGHPAADTLAALAERGIPLLRTDESGTIEIEVAKADWRVG